MPKVFRVTRTDGYVEIMTVADGADMSDCLVKWRATGKMESDIAEITLAAIPTDRTFRDAWEGADNSGVSSIGVNMAKARNIHMAKIRKARDAALLVHDAAFTKALGKKNQAEADAVEAKRQALRDLPANTDLTVATTPSQLKAIWPDELK